ncbi:prepilin-type cleavage/methylation domain-containing protein [Methylobacterium sp. J-076]|uniref:prepilin-type cleavage/methylation domain-containing protein n=1 Tax=Methylobacterium sp. J-076 TaxID=2836655 RepID=UPI001FB86AAD|nr:prepilin-type cleavage/methylation domain-containing protein [Methylobacterium sp. J-076]MCJ2011912.1 prepilin-type cleavage/methylation domain-containing protein [Methylobacterium sp. J-076]
MALAISGAVLVGLYSLTNVVSRHARLAFGRVEASEADRRGLAALAREIEFAQRLRWAAPPEARPFVFFGSADSLLFAIDPPIGSPGAPSRLVQIKSVVTPDGGELLRAEAALPPSAHDIADLVPEPTRPLHRGPWRVRFAYIAAATAKTPEIAFEAWDLPDAMPVAVRLSLEDPETGLVTQSLRVALRMEAESGCAAPTKGFCSRSADREGDEGVSTAAIVNALQGRKP